MKRSVCVLALPLAILGCCGGNTKSDTTPSEPIPSPDFSEASAPPPRAASEVALVESTLGVPVLGAYVKASNPREFDTFGGAVALSGDTLAVGATGEDSGDGRVDGDQTDASADDSGAVYVFRRDGESWVQEAYVKAPNPDVEDIFGVSIALDGDTLAVAASWEASAARGVGGDQADNSAKKSGAVYVYQRSGTTWTLQAYLKASNAEAGDWFGASVALSGDTLAVGALGEDSGASGIGGDQADNGASDSGAVYIFRRNASAWTQETYLKAPNPDASDAFGGRLALAGDTLVVAAKFEDGASRGVDGDQSSNAAVDTGAVYVYRRSGTRWQQEAYLKASNPDRTDRLGSSVALSGDTLAVSAEPEDSSATGVDGDQADNAADFSGAVYVYRRSGTRWQQEAYVKASNTEEMDGFGTSLALYGDILAVGSTGEDSSATGIDGDQNNNDADASGAVYLFRRSGTTWRQEAYLKAPNSEEDDSFGSSVALGSDVLVVGADGEDGKAAGIGGDQSNGTDSAGAVYIYH